MRSKLNEIEAREREREDGHYGYIGRPESKRRFYLRNFEVRPKLRGRIMFPLLAFYLSTLAQLAFVSSPLFFSLSLFSSSYCLPVCVPRLPPRPSSPR